MTVSKDPYAHLKRRHHRVSVRQMNERQKAFVREYLIDLNATQAAIRAGYSKRNAEHMGAEVKNTPIVAAAIKVELDKRATRVEVKQDEVLRELLAVARADLREAYNPDGTLKPIKEWPDAVAAFVCGMEVEELYEGHGRDRHSIGQVRKIKLSPKVPALELLMRHLGILNDKRQITGKDGAPLIPPARELSDEQLQEKVTEALAVLGMEKK